MSRAGICRLFCTGRSLYNAVEWRAELYVCAQLRSYSGRGQLRAMNATALQTHKQLATSC